MFGLPRCRGAKWGLSGPQTVGEGQYPLFLSSPGDRDLGPEVYVVDHVDNEGNFDVVPSNAVGVSVLAPERGGQGPWHWGRAPGRYWWEETWGYNDEKSP